MSFSLYQVFSSSSSSQQSQAGHVILIVPARCHHHHHRNSHTQAWSSGACRSHCTSSLSFSLYQVVIIIVIFTLFVITTSDNNNDNDLVFLECPHCPGPFLSSNVVGIIPDNPSSCYEMLCHSHKGLLLQTAIRYATQVTDVE